MKFQILHTNDMHNHFPGNLLTRLKKPDGILLDSGDALAGSNTVFRVREPILEKMNALGYQAMAMGNREFHYLRRVIEARQKSARFPILSANVVDLRKQLPIPDSRMIEIGGLKVGLFGLTVVQYPIGSIWETLTGWRFFSPKEVVMEIPRRLRKAGAVFVICLSHLGLFADKEIAELGEIDLILGGHSHSVLREPLWITPTGDTPGTVPGLSQGCPRNSKMLEIPLKSWSSGHPWDSPGTVPGVSRTGIVQGGSHGRYVGNWQLDVNLDRGTFKSWTLEGELVESRSYKL